MTDKRWRCWYYSSYDSDITSKTENRCRLTISDCNEVCNNFIDVCDKMNENKCKYYKYENTGHMCSKVGKGCPFAIVSHTEQTQQVFPEAWAWAKCICHYYEVTKIVYRVHDEDVIISTFTTKEQAENYIKSLQITEEPLE